MQIHSSTLGSHHKMRTFRLWILDCLHMLLHILLGICLHIFQHTCSKHEFVRHKILDLIGDLFNAGGSVIGKVNGHKTSHALNNKFLHKIFEDLSIEDGLICRNNQIIVPKSAENIVLNHLHSVCQGADKIKTFARGRYYWSIMKADIERFGANCKNCREFLQSQQKQGLNFSNASRPFEELGIDCYDCCRK